VVELLPGPIENQPSVINVNDYLDLPAAEPANVQISIANNVDVIHLAPSEPVFGSIVVRAEDSFLVALAKDNSTHYFNVRTGAVLAVLRPSTRAGPAVAESRDSQAVRIVIQAGSWSEGGQHGGHELCHWICGSGS
jgi:hypothetical protein